MEQSVPAVTMGQASALPAAPAPVAPPQESRLWVEDSGPWTARLKREGCWLAILSLVIALSFLLPTLQSRGAWINLPCLFHLATGLPCLFCGMTRSFVMTAHGNLAAAFDLHLAGPILFAGACALAVYMSASLATGRRVRFTLARRPRAIVFWTVLGTFVALWIIKLACLPKTW